MNIRILLVDDQTLFRQCVSNLISNQPDMSVVGEATTGQEAVAKAREVRPEIVLIDVEIPGLSAFDVSKQVKKNNPTTKVIFLTIHEDEEYLRQALGAGSDGYLLKSATTEQLLIAIHEVFGGGNYLSPRMTTLLIQEFRNDQKSSRLRLPRFSTLTVREREILKMLAEGNSVREIAAELNLSIKTVEAHKFNLMKKLDIHSTAHLVHYAIEHKIIKIHNMVQMNRPA